MNRFLFALCSRLFHHARWIPTWTPSAGRHCLCGRHFVFQAKRLPEIVGKNKAMQRLLWKSRSQ